MFCFSALRFRLSGQEPEDHVGLLGSANTIRTRRAFGRLYLCGDGTSDVSGVLGLVSARVAVCAAHQAHMILRLLAGETEP